jgi:hypothetical protein
LRRPVESALEDVLEVVDYASAREQRAVSEELHRRQPGGQFWMSISDGWHRIVFGRDQSSHEETRKSWLIPVVLSFAVSVIVLVLGVSNPKPPESASKIIVPANPGKSEPFSSSRWLVESLDRTTLKPVETAHVFAFVSTHEETPPLDRLNDKTLPFDRLEVKQVDAGRFEIWRPSWLRPPSGEEFRWIYLYVFADAYEPFEGRYRLNQERIQVYLDKKKQTTDSKEQRRIKKTQRWSILTRKPNENRQR